MALPFRRRIFLILVVMTAVPTVLAVAGWVLSARRLLPAAGARASTERVAATARGLLEGVDTLLLTRLMGVNPDAPSLDWIGMQVRPRFLRNSKLKPTDVYFVPAKE